MRLLAHETGDSDRARHFALRLPHPFWFFLATVVLIVLGVGLRFGLPIYRQWAAIRHLSALGAAVRTEQTNPEWLRWWIDGEIFASAVYLNCTDDPVTDADLRYLSSLPALRELCLKGTAITDLGLVHLEGLNTLSVLWLDDTQVGDVGLEYLTSLSSLKELYLENTRITDAGMISVRKLGELEVLSIANTRLTNAGLRDIAKMESLQFLCVQGTGVTDAGLIHLQNMPDLRNLWLTETQAADPGHSDLTRARPSLRIEIVY